jgi:hypothetical protein
MEYTAEDISVSVHHYPVDGSQITVRKYVNRNWIEVVDSRFICDSFWEAMCDALSYAGYDWDNAVSQCFEWGIEEPEYEEED